MCCVCIVLPAWGLVSRFSGLLLCPRCVGEVRHNKISGITNVTISCIMYAPQLLRILLHEFMLWFTLSNAKAKLTVSMPIGRLSATVWGREHKQRKNGIWLLPAPKKRHIHVYYQTLSPPSECISCISCISYCIACISTKIQCLNTKMLR